MNRRYFLLLGCAPLISSCTAFQLGWKIGGLCDTNEASTVQFNFGNNSISFTDVLKVSRLEAETQYLKVLKQGFEPRPGAIVADALNRTGEFIEFLHERSFSVTGVNSPFEVYKNQLCSFSCVKENTDCNWRDEFTFKLNKYLVSAKK